MIMTFVYNGPVMYFDQCVASAWHGETIAPTEAKARNNLTYRFKKENRMGANTRITLPGPITKKEEL